jgi:hypothetical protein
MQEVGSSSRCRTTAPPSCQEEASSDNSVEIGVVAPPPPPLTSVEEDLFDDSPSGSSGYNDECPHIKVVNSYELSFESNCLV